MGGMHPYWRLRLSEGAVEDPEKIRGSEIADIKYNRGNS